MSYSNKLRDAVLSYDLEKITSEMVKIPSYSFMEEQEKEISEYILNFFEKEGIECHMDKVAEGRYNVTGRLPGKNPEAPALILCGHTDTVPAYEYEDPFSGEIRDGKVYGRGSTDMKGPDAAMMVALAAIKRAGIELEGDLYFCGVADEEEQGLGAAYLCDHMPENAAACIVGEASAWGVWHGQKGLEWIDVDIIGRQVHAGESAHGVNAIEMAARFINRIYEEYVPVLKSRAYPVLGAPTINMGRIEGGDQPSTVAGLVRIRLDRRCVPTESIEQVYEELNEIAAKLHEEDPNFNCEIRDTFGGATLRHEPFLVPEEADIVQAVLKARDDTRAEEPIQKAEYPLDNWHEIVTGAAPCWTDAGFINDRTDVASIVFGPVGLNTAHTVHEAMDINQLYEVAYVYARAAINFLG